MVYVQMVSSLRNFHPLRAAASAGLKGALPKVLVGAALLGGGGSVLFAGSAAAFGWVPPDGPGVNVNSTTWTFTNTDGTWDELPNSVYTSPLVIDKRVTLLQWASVPVGTPTSSDLEFSYEPTDQFTPWHVDLDFNPDDPNGGSLVYKIEIDQTACTQYPNNSDVGCDFRRVNFISARDGDTSLTKTYGTGWDGTNITGIIDTLSLTNNVSDNGPAFGKVLYVKDVWNGPGNIDNLSNEFAQVPAPLPLLGAGAAFGSVRRLRKFSSLLKKPSMA